MSEYFFTSDPHFGHGNIIKYCQRPFLTTEDADELKQNHQMKVSQASIQNMDEKICSNINEVVGKEDILYCLGDWMFMYLGKNPSIQKRLDYIRKCEEYRARIECKNVHLIYGNHDYHNLLCGTCFFSSINFYKELKINKTLIIMCHYAMRVWNRSHQGSWNLYGHSHNMLSDIPENLVDVGVDGHNFMPWSYNEIGNYMRKKLLLLNETKSERKI